MPTGLLIGLGLIPSMLFAYVVLSTFYGSNRAYVAISWLPVSYLVLIWVFKLILKFQNLSDNWWQDLATTILWASLVQAALGVGLAVRALSRHQWPFGVLVATLFAATPFFLRLIS